jgi:hypothetical protein
MHLDLCLHILSCAVLQALLQGFVMPLRLVHKEKFFVHVVVSAGWELTINAFPPGQVLKEYCRAEATGDVTGVLSCTAVDKKQQNLLC